MSTNIDNQAIPAACPMHQDKPKLNIKAIPAECPMLKAASPAGFNPDNNMPYLPNKAVAGQEINLPLDKEISSIPKAESSSKGESVSRWEYPSPQQFYNALVRKGYETPIESVETMVDIHNFLNEGAWGEILKWEKFYEHECQNPKLLRFTGKPSQLSPKAWFCSTFLGSPKPFDRHDWIVDRAGKPVRYIIDYYGGEENPHDDVPVFVLDVRPALDSLSSVKDRLAVVISDFFKRFQE